MAQEGKAKTYWASEDEYRDWFGASVITGRIDQPSIAFGRPFTLMSDENGIELPTEARATT